jgi:hypothetical protein
MNSMLMEGMNSYPTQWPSFLSISEAAIKPIIKGRQIGGKLDTSIPITIC